MDVTQFRRFSHMTAPSYRPNSIRRKAEEAKKVAERSLQDLKQKVQLLGVHNVCVSLIVSFFGWLAGWLAGW